MYEPQEHACLFCVAIIRVEKKRVANWGANSEHQIIVWMPAQRHYRYGSVASEFVCLFTGQEILRWAISNPIFKKKINLTWFTLRIKLKQIVGEDCRRDHQLRKFANFFSLTDSDVDRHTVNVARWIYNNYLFQAVSTTIKSGTTYSSLYILKHNIMTLQTLQQHGQTTRTIT